MTQVLKALGFSKIRVFESYWAIDLGSIFAFPENVLPVNKMSLFDASIEIANPSSATLATRQLLIVVSLVSASTIPDPPSVILTALMMNPLHLSNRRAPLSLVEA